MSDAEVDRVYKLTVIRAPELVDIKALDRSFFEEFETITEITDHRIEFKVEKHLERTPNQAEVTITNLSAVTRDEFASGTPMKVRLEAGYDNTPRLLFLGDVRFASNEHKGTEWLTKLQLGDGARAYAEARVNHSFAKGTPISTVIARLAKSFGVALPAEVTASPELSARLAAGEVITGYASDELDRLLVQFGFEWSFQNGILQIIRFDAIVPGQIRVLNTPPDGGILESPVIAPPKILATPKRPSKRHRVPKLTVKHTLYPELTPGQKIEVQSRSVNGTFRIDKVTHEGDNFGDAWTSVVEATAA